MEESIFLRLYGDTAKNRVWNFLIVHQEYDYSMKDIAEYSKVGYTTLKMLWKDFVKNNLVIQTRTVGMAKMFKLNLKNPVVQKFIEFYWTVIDQEVDRKLRKEKVKISV